MLVSTHALTADRQAWLTELRSRIAEQEINKIDAILPRAWCRSRPEAASTPNAARLTGRWR